jgi:hypothetical protein
MRAAQRTDAVVYVVAPPSTPAGSTLPHVITSASGTVTTVVGSSTGGTNAGVATRMLDALARTTGGRLLTLPASGDIGPSFLKALEEFRQSYLLRYIPAGVASAGWHALTVSVKGNKKYVVRAKQGYEGGK